MSGSPAMIAVGGVARCIMARLMRSRGAAPGPDQVARGAEESGQR
jgi:hypothetical protein